MSKHSARHDVLIVSWGGGGNLPPLLAAGKLLAARDHRVSVLASAARVNRPWTRASMS